MHRRKATTQYVRAALLTGVAAVAMPAHSVEPARVQWGPLFVEPVLEMDLSYTDNLYRTASNKTDAWQLKTRPSVRAWLDNQGSLYGLLYELEDGRYDVDYVDIDGDGEAGEGDDDYTDHRIRADIDHHFNSKNRLKAFGEYHITHEDRGTGLLEGFQQNLFDEPIEYDHTSYGVQYLYGNWAGKGRVELSYEDHDFEYQNFRQITEVYDYEQQRILGTFFWNLSGRTAALLEGRYFETHYQEERALVADPDSEEYQLLLGADWQASGKTRGKLKLGYYDRQYKDARREDADGFSWDIGINWRPKTYSSVDLTTKRMSRETNGLGDFINSKEYAISWTHDFTTRDRLIARALYADDDYKGFNVPGAAREDDRYEVHVGYVRKIRRWLDLGIVYRYEERSTTQKEYDDRFDRDLEYTRNSIGIELDISL